MGKCLHTLSQFFLKKDKLMKINSSTLSFLRRQESSNCQKVLFSLIIGTFFLFPFYFFSVEADSSCPYQSQVEQCIAENENGDPRSIDDFVCPQSQNNEKTADQVVLDLKAKQIDKDMEQELKNIENNCGTWYGEKPTEDELTASNKITSIFWYHGKYRQKYNQILSPSNSENVLQTAINCIWGKGSISVADSLMFQSTAQWMFDTQLVIAQNTAYDLLEICKQKVRSDERKKMVQRARGKYGTVSDLFNSVLNYLERIRKKWPSKIKNNYL